MSKTARILLQWTEPDGSDKALIHVVNEDLDPSEVDYQWLELSEKDDDQWKTLRDFSYVEQFQDFGIPEDLID